MSKNIQPLTQKILDKALTSQSKVILGAVSDKFEKIDDKFKKVDQKFEKIDDKFKKVDDKFKLIRKDILTGQDKICKQLTDLIQESKVSTELYKFHDGKIEKHEKRIGDLELNIQQISNK